MLKNRYFKLELLYQFIFFLINPFLGLLSSLYYMVRRYSLVNAVSMALSLSLIFIYLPIMFDVSSRYYHYYYAQHNLADLKIYNVVVELLHRFLGFEYMSTVYLYTTLILFISIFIFNYFKKLISTKYDLIIITIFFLSSIIYRNIMDLQRFYVGVFIFLLFIFVIEYKQIKFKLIFFITTVIISISMHFSLVLISIIYLLSLIKINKYILIFLPFIALYIGTNSYEVLLFILDSPLTASIDPQEIVIIKTYIDPNSIWGSKNIMLSLVRLRYIELPLMFLLYYKGIQLLKIKNNNTTIKFILLLMSLTLIFLPYLTLYERYSGIFLIFSLFIVYESVLHLKKDLILYIIIFLFIIRSLYINVILYGMIYTSEYNKILPNEQKKSEMIAKPFFYPTALLLWVENYGYSDKYIQKESRRGKIGE